MYVVATDVGGTCTDTVIIAENDELRVGKVLSTPPTFAEGVMQSIESAAREIGLSVSELLENTDLFVHGSTVVENTILTRTGSTTGLLTTEGFEDTLFITRGPYGRWAGLGEDGLKHPVMTDRPVHVVAEELTCGVPERVDYKGAVLRPLDEDVVESRVERLMQSAKIDAVAICFLWGFRNEQHERRVGEIIKASYPETYVCLSSDIAPVPGEYERMATTVLNAYAGPTVHDYLKDLERRLRAAGYHGAVLVMQGYGGLVPAEQASSRAINMIESGPTAGVIGSKNLGSVMGDGNVISADMGGTTFKIGVIEDGALEYAREPLVERFHYVAPKIEIVSIGSGGGSIVSLDPRTSLPKVGPQSAGADPGPVCYGRGGSQITLTDVLLLAGYLPPALLGGTLELDVRLAAETFDRDIAAPMGMPREEAVAGICEIAVAQTADLIREVTVERGIDPRDFVLHAFGGTCPILCSLYLDELGVQRVIVPYTASVHAGFGLATADVVHEYTRTQIIPVLEGELEKVADEVNKSFGEMVEEAQSQLMEDGFQEDEIRLDWAIDLHYLRQVHEVTTPLRESGPLDEEKLVLLANDFRKLYEQKFGPGSTYEGAGIEMTMFRLTARGLRDVAGGEEALRRAADRVASEVAKDEKLEDNDTRRLYDGVGKLWVEATVHEFDNLRPGTGIVGPAVIHTPITTIVVREGQIAQKDSYQNVVLERRRA